MILANFFILQTIILDMLMRSLLSLNANLISHDPFSINVVTTTRCGNNFNIAMYELMYFVVHKLKESRNKPAVIRNVMHFLVKSRLNIHIFACNVMCVK